MEFARYSPSSHALSAPFPPRRDASLAKPLRVVKHLRASVARSPLISLVLFNLNRNRFALFSLCMPLCPYPPPPLMLYVVALASFKVARRYHSRAFLPLQCRSHSPAEGFLFVYFTSSFLPLTILYCTRRFRCVIFFVDSRYEVGRRHWSASRGCIRLF